jgi:hypothetical protein
MDARTKAMLRKRYGGKLYDPRSYAQLNGLSSPFPVHHRTGDPDLVHTAEDPASCACRAPRLADQEVPF